MGLRNVVVALSCGATAAYNVQPLGRGAQQQQHGVRAPAVVMAVVRCHISNMGG